jgi:hypothetical protein
MITIPQLSRNLVLAIQVYVFIYFYLFFRLLWLVLPVD